MAGNLWTSNSNCKSLAICDLLSACESCSSGASCTCFGGAAGSFGVAEDMLGDGWDEEDRKLGIYK